MIARSLLLAWCGLVLSLGSFVHAAPENSTQASVEYIELGPSFIANIGSPGSNSRFSYVKTDVVLQAADPAAKETIEYHMPYIRNEIVLLLSRQDFTELRSHEGKEKLRQEALTRVQEVLQQEEGAPLVEDLLFSTFVIQR